MTQERPATAAATAPAAEPAGGLAGVLGSGDHKTIGRLYIAASLLFAAVGGVLGALVSAERLDTATIDVVGNDAFAQVFSLHSVTMVFLFLLPLWLGIAITVVPLQIGATTLAFPRAAAASVWLYIVSAVLVLGAYGINGGAFGGDFEGVDLFLVGFGALLVALILATVCVVTTVLTLRTSGMTLERTPFFSWSMLVAGTVWLLSLPVLFGLGILLYLDHHYGEGQSGIFLGGAEGIYARLQWMFEQPQIWALAVPGLGVCADVIPVFARRRQRSYGVVMTLIGAVGVLGFGAWTIARLTSPRLVEQALYVVMAFAVLVVLLALVGGWFTTLVAGQARLGSPLFFALGATVLLLGAAATGAIGAIDGLNLQVLGGQDTTWATGVTHAVLLAATIAAIGALHYWAPKLFGRELREAPAKLAAGLIFFGAALLTAPDLVSGALDQLQFTPSPVRDSVEALNSVAFAGGLVVALALVIVIANLIRSLAVAQPAQVPDDPWKGQTLEWATASPPPIGNFAEPVEVSSPAPLLDQREEAEQGDKNTTEEGD